MSASLSGANKSTQVPLKSLLLLLQTSNFGPHALLYGSSSVKCSCKAKVSEGEGGSGANVKPNDEWMKSLRLGVVWPLELTFDLLNMQVAAAAALSWARHVQNSLHGRGPGSRHA